MLTLSLTTVAAADAALYRGTSDLHHVTIRLWTNPKGKPYSVAYGKYKVPCTNGYRLGYRVAGFNPPYDVVTGNRLVSRYEFHTHKKDVVIDLHARRRDDTWYGRFFANWVFRHHGRVYTRCGIHWSFVADLVKPG